MVSWEEFMKRARVILMIGVVLACGSAAVAETVGTHKVYLPPDIKWGPAPPSLPAGAEAAVLFGDPAKEGMFALRIRAPKDYRIPPHMHSKPELLTVISGEFGLAWGQRRIAPRSNRCRLAASRRCPPASSITSLSTKSRSFRSTQLGLGTSIMSTQGAILA